MNEEEATVSPAPSQLFTPKPKPSILPLIFGFLVVIVMSAVFGIVYYKNKLTVSSSPSPTPSIAASPTIEPSVSPSSTASASPKSSVKPTSVPTVKPSVAPTPTPIPLPTLDIRFGNPSANVKQTIDEGTGDGRVINREYSSIQVGQFDEVSSSWSPRVTVCYHIVSNETIFGKDLKYTFTLDDKVEVEDNLGGYDKLEAGRLYDWCHDVTISIGKHTAKLLLNGDKSLKEINYTNDLARLEWENLSDKIPPNFTLVGPTQTDLKTCFSLLYISDNVTPTNELKIQEKLGINSNVDNTDWVTTTATSYCTPETLSDLEHKYSVKIIDSRGNVNEQSKIFVPY